MTKKLVQQFVGLAHDARSHHEHDLGVGKGGGVKRACACVRACVRACVFRRLTSRSLVSR